MTENNQENAKGPTFGESIAKIYESLNNNEIFKEKFKDDTFKILLNPKDGKDAALITIDKGFISVNSIDNSSKDNLDKTILGWDGFIQTTIELFNAIGKGKLSGGDFAKKVATRKIKIKNPKILKKFSELGALLNH